jgi:hypothetical protein
MQVYDWIWTHIQKIHPRPRNARQPPTTRARIFPEPWVETVVPQYAPRSVRALIRSEADPAWRRQMLGRKPARIPETVLDVMPEAKRPSATQFQSPAAPGEPKGQIEMNEYLYISKQTKTDTASIGESRFRDADFRQGFGESSHRPLRPATDAFRTQASPLCDMLTTTLLAHS